MNFNFLPHLYERLNAKYKVTNNNLDSATYTNVDSNFVYSANFARHRWFNYKEGFSPILVERIFDEYALTPQSVVCDPFCGAGTTLAVAKAKGMHSFGFEVNPFASFITRTKTDNYNLSDMEKLQALLFELKDIDANKIKKLPDNEYLCRIFAGDMLITQLNIRDYIMELPVGKPRNLLYFAWLCTLENCSLYRKAGNGLKIKKNGPSYEENMAFQYAFTKIEDKINSMVEDYSITDNGPLPQVLEDSATMMNTKIEDNSLDLVLFSPPYANCFDYTKIYYLELWFGGFINSTLEQKAIRMKSVRSHCHATWPERYESFHLDELNDELIPLLREQKLWTKRIPDMLNGYFADMEETLRHIYSALKDGGHCSIVVSNSAYAGVIVPTDVFLAMIAERLGFTVKEIEVERLIITSSQQYKKTEHLRKYLRESIVKLEK